MTTSRLWCLPTNRPSLSSASPSCSWLPLFPEKGFSWSQHLTLCWQGHASACVSTGSMIIMPGNTVMMMMLPFARVPGPCFGSDISRPVQITLRYERVTNYYVRFVCSSCCENKYAIIDSIHIYHMPLHVPCRYRPTGHRL